MSVSTDLFSNIAVQPENLLPRDGIVNYYGALIPFRDADHYLNSLLANIDWKNDEINFFGKHIVTRRKAAWYGDQPFTYTYSGSTKLALPWTKELLALKIITEQKSGETFNSCLLNLYHDGSEGMSWHSDSEQELKKQGAIASLSFGAERKFSFKHKQTKETLSLVLEHGSLLLMTGTIQAHWLHQLPTTKTVSSPRVNLTFRTIN
jgi:alkylated DNA repair dioxygenase AlkB